MLTYRSEVGNRSTAMLLRDAPKRDVKARALVTITTTDEEVLPKNGSITMMRALASAQTALTIFLPHL